MNYQLGLASAEFHVSLSFPWFAAHVKAHRTDEELIALVRGVLQAEAEILPDHSFGGGPPRYLQSRATQDDLFRGSSNRGSAWTLTSCGGFRSGAEISAEFESGSPVSWRFNRDQARLLVTLPRDLGGRTYEMAFEGGYTFAPVGRLQPLVRQRTRNLLFG